MKGKFLKIVSLFCSLALIMATVPFFGVIPSAAATVNDAGYYYFEDFEASDFNFEGFNIPTVVNKSIGTEDTTSLMAPNNNIGKYIRLESPKWNDITFPFEMTAGTYKITYDYDVSQNSCYMKPCTNSSNHINHNNDNLWRTRTYTETVSENTKLAFYAGGTDGNIIRLDNIVVAKLMDTTVAFNATEGSANVSASTAYYNETVTYTATPNDGYKFVKWQDSTGAFVSADATYVHTVGKDNALTAVFEKIVNYYYFEDFSNANIDDFSVLGSGCSKTITSDDAEATRGNYLEVGTTAQFHDCKFPFYFDKGTYKISYDYNVTAWSYMNSGAYGTSSKNKWSNISFEYSAEAGNQLVFYSGTAGEQTLKLDNIKVQKLMDVSATATDGGTAVIADNATTAFYNDEITYTATASDGYKFIEWQDSKGAFISADATYVHTVGEDNALTAVFEKIVNYYYFEDFSDFDPSILSGVGSITKELSTDPNETARGQYLKLTMGMYATLNLPFTLDEGTYQISYDYKVTNWCGMFADKDSGNGVSGADKWNSTTYTYTATESKNLYFFAGITDGDNTVLLDNIKVQKLMDVSVSADVGGSAAIADNAETAFYNDKIRYTATADKGYIFKEWQDAEGNPVSTEAIYDYTVGEANALKAVFEKDIFGDVNGDGDITNDDLTLFRKYLLGVSGVINEEYADANKDQKLDICDLVTIAEKLA